MNPLDELLACRKGLYIHRTTQGINTNIHAPRGIRTRDPSKQSAKAYAFDGAATVTDAFFI
jgi:hypothetical protein